MFFNCDMYKLSYFINYLSNYVILLLLFNKNANLKKS